MSRKTNCLEISFLKVTIIAIIVHSGILSYAQNYEWEIDKLKIKEQENRRKLDSSLVHLKNNWQLSIGYGQWFFNNAAKSTENSFLDFPKNMSAWNLSCARFLSEQISVNVNLGILIKKIQPSRPDVFSVLNGANVEVEGGGIIFMPISVGMDYYFLKRRFRPYAGFSVGIVPARFKYVEASGSIANDIKRNEYEFNSSATFGELSAGFIYRTGKKVQWGLNCDYLQSKDFSTNIGGYKAYNGFKISVMFSLLF